MTRWNGPVIATIDMLIALFVVALALMADPKTELQANSDRPICHLAVDMQWKDRDLSDVDLWVKAPGDRPVGYSAREGVVFNLVRDDLGGYMDITSLNSERACARGLPEGEWIVNTHLYSARSPLPLSITITVSLVNPSSAFMEEIISRTIQLKYSGEEVTAVRFKIKDGKLVNGSQNEIPIGLRENKGGEIRSIR